MKPGRLDLIQGHGFARRELHQPTNGEQALVLFGLAGFFGWRLHPGWLVSLLT